ncbi:MAG: VOC family protein [Candidatus Poribacteria bacterium]
MQFSAAVVFVHDVPATLEFYERAFGFPTKFYDEEYGFGELDTGEATLAVASHACADFVMRGAHEPSEAASSVEIAFTTPDVDAAFARAVAAGAQIVTEPWSPPWGGTISYVRSVEGTLIGLVSPVEG